MFRTTCIYVIAVLVTVMYGCKTNGNTDTPASETAHSIEERKAMAEGLEIPVAVVISWEEVFPGIPIRTAHTLAPDGDTICILNNDTGDREYTLQAKPDGSVMVRTIEDPMAISELPAVVVDSFKYTFPDREIAEASVLHVNDELLYDVSYFWKTEGGLEYYRGLRIYADGKVQGRIYSQRRVGNQ